MHDVARRARVSTKTVSNVVNRQPHVHESTRARVEQAIDELGYRPNLSARGLRSGRSGVVVLAVPDLRRPRVAELADAVVRAAGTHDLRVLVSRTDADRQLEVAALTDGLRQADGLLLCAEHLGAQDRALLDAVDHPLVLLGERVVGSPTDQVTTDDVAAASAAVQHLVAGGRRRVALVGAPSEALLETGCGGTRPADLRLRGYRQALEAAGLTCDARLVVPAAPWRPAEGVAAARALLSSGVPFDAVLALDDALALGVVRALGETGRGVPSDVAVMGLDDTALGACAVPSLSSVDLGREEVARTGVAMLVERIGGGDAAGPPRLHEAAHRVVVRESTASVDG